MRMMMTLLLLPLLLLLLVLLMLRSLECRGEQRRFCFCFSCFRDAGEREVALSALRGFERLERLWLERIESREEGVGREKGQRRERWLMRALRGLRAEERRRPSSPLRA
jgi:hypothetical protein